jgi:hypothetical protein
LRGQQIARKATPQTTAVFDDGRIENRAVMDIETSEAIERLGHRMDAVESSLRNEFRAGFAEMDARMETGFAEMEDRMETSFAEMETRMETGFAAMETRMETGLAESRRHIDVLIESLRDDIRILAEGFATLSAKRDSDRR